MNRQNNFDFLRLFAACQVMFSHSWNWLHLGDGNTSVALFSLLFSVPGVAIFFVISGFLVTDSYVRSSSIKSFFVKRSLRIYPALIANIAVMETALWVTGGLVVVGMWDYLSYLFVYFSTASRPWAIYLLYEPYTMSGFYAAAYPSGVLWTLTVELSFYLMLPILLEVWRRWNRAGTVLVVIAAAASWFMAQHVNLTNSYHPVLSLTAGPSLWMFAIGVLARLCWHRIRYLFEGKVVWWLVAHLAVTWWVAGGNYAYLSLNNATPVDAIRVMLLGGLVMSAAFSFPKPDLLRKQDLSYGIYLYHMLVIHTFVAIGWVGYWWLWLALPVATLVLASLSWFVIEKPTIGIRTILASRKLLATTATSYP